MGKNTGFTVVLISSSWKGVNKLKHRGWAATRDEAKKIADQFREKSDAFYRVCSDRQLKELEKEIKVEQLARRRAGAKKTAVARKAKGPNNFIRCPMCGAKSKKLYSEFGGLQTRKCQNNHTFEFDKWIADRPLLGL